jgi:hypothetical protein
VAAANDQVAVAQLAAAQLAAAAIPSRMRVNQSLGRAESDHWHYLFGTLRKPGCSTRDGCHSRAFFLMTARVQKPRAVRGLSSLVRDLRPPRRSRQQRLQLVQVAGTASYGARFGYRAKGHSDFWPGGRCKERLRGVETRITQDGRRDVSSQDRESGKSENRLGPAGARTKPNSGVPFVNTWCRGIVRALGTGGPGPGDWRRGGDHDPRCRDHRPANPGINRVSVGSPPA